MASQQTKLVDVSKRETKVEHIHIESSDREAFYGALLEEVTNAEASGGVVLDVHVERDVSNDGRWVANMSVMAGWQYVRYGKVAETAGTD